VVRNRFEEQIAIRSEAVGKENGEMSFELGPEEQMGWGGLNLAPSERSQQVPVIRLDSALIDVDQIDLLKIDIEGADTWALLGAERLLRERRIKHIWWEQHKPRMRELRIPEGQAFETLAGFGYRPEPQGSCHDEIVNWYAKVP
jgi:hypothetical protein